MKEAIVFFVIYLLISPAMAADAIKDFSLKLGAVNNQFGALKADFVIDNRNPFAISDVRFTCVMYAQSGTEVKLVNLVILRTFPANKKTAVRSFDIGYMPPQGATISCTETVARRN